MYDKTQFTKNHMAKLQKSYDKTYDTSLAVVRQHQAHMQ